MTTSPVEPGDIDFGIARVGITLVSRTGVTLAREMDAAVWTAIGLLAVTSLGTLFYLGSRMDAPGRSPGCADGRRVREGRRRVRQG
jgi:hypothetical protein